MLAAEDRVCTGLLPRLIGRQRDSVQALLDGIAVWPAGNVAWAATSARYRHRQLTDRGGTP